jgi:hypothetical protein
VTPNDLTFTVRVQLDSAAIEREGKRQGLTIEKARASIAADVEGRLSDAIRWRDAVVSVGVSVVEG